MSKVSFTVRRPSPVSRGASSGPDSDSGFKIPALPRHLAQDSTPGSPLSRSHTSSPATRYDDDSSDDDEEQDELVTSFDAMGAQRLRPPKKTPQGPLVIPAQKNKDWRELAKKRRGANQFVPESGKAATGQDGSVGGLGTRDSINSGPVLSGLQVRSKKVVDEWSEDVTMSAEGEVDMVDVQEEPQTEEQLALRAILAEASGEQQGNYSIGVIPPSISEEDALKRDIDELPDVATLDDYNRVPVEQFGLALLRGMGWKEGTAASRKPGKGMVQPYLPEARPALLGIGAKEQEVFDNGSGKKASKRPEKRYVPVVRRETDSREGSSSRDVSRRSSRSPSRRRNYDDRRSDDKYRDGRRADGRRDSTRRDYDGDRRNDRDDRRRDYEADSRRKRRD